MYGGSGCSASQQLSGSTIDGGRATNDGEREVLSKAKPIYIDGKKYKMRYGSRRQVYNGTAYMTKGNLKQRDIVKNKQDRFVSLKKSLMAKKEQRLLKYGYGAVKGKFGYVRVDKNGNPLKKTSRGVKKSVKKSVTVQKSPVSKDSMNVSQDGEDANTYAGGLTRRNKVGRATRSRSGKRRRGKGSRRTYK